MNENRTFLGNGWSFPPALDKDGIPTRMATYEEHTPEPVDAAEHIALQTCPPLPAMSPPLSPRRRRYRQGGLWLMQLRSIDKELKHSNVSLCLRSK